MASTMSAKSSPETVSSPDLPSNSTMLVKPTVSGALEQLKTEAKSDFEELSKCLTNIDLKHTAQEAVQLADKMIRGAEHILTYANAIASLHPIAGAVVGAVQKVVALERQRRDNNAQIAAVHFSMVTAIYHLKILIPMTEVEENEHKAHLDSMFQKMVKTVNEFGGFVDFYHKCWQRIYKVLLASHHKRKLDEFHISFESHRVELDRFVNTHLAAKTQEKLNSLSDTIKRIAGRLLDPELTIAEQFVKSAGGAAAVTNNDEHLQTLASKLGERVTDNMKATLRQDFEGSLKMHAERYEMKLQSVEHNVISSVYASHMELSRKFDSGPHELIDDEEIRTIWKNNGWKAGVKGRVFVEALHESYQHKFNNHNSSSEGIHHEDAWTVEFFSRMKYHSAIGDIVDEDGSGFITASEMNVFCGRRPMGWSVPEWFAFCAAGWYNNNAWYYRCIKDMVVEIEQGAKDVPDEHGRLLRDIILALKPLLLVEDIDDSPDSATPHHLHRLQERHRDQEIRKMETNVKKLHYHLEDNLAVIAVMGDTRIELHVISMFYVIVKRLHEIIIRPKSRKRTSLKGELNHIEDLATSCMVVFLAFEGRMAEIMRGWRCQGHDIDLQLGRYADGLFKDIQREARMRNKALQSLCNILFGDTKTPARYRSMIETASRTPHSQLGDLASQITRLTDRVIEVERLLQHHLQQQSVGNSTLRVTPLASPRQEDEKHFPDQEPSVEELKPADETSLKEPRRWRRWFLKKLTCIPF